MRGKVFIELSIYFPTSPHYEHGQDPISPSRRGEEWRGEGLLDPSESVH